MACATLIEIVFLVCFYDSTGNQVYIIVIFYIQAIDRLWMYFRGKIDV